MWFYLVLVYSIANGAAGLSGLLDGLVEWHASVKPMFAMYLAARNWLLDLVPFVKLPGWVGDYLVLGQAVTVGFIYERLRYPFGRGGPPDLSWPPDHMPDGPIKPSFGGALVFSILWVPLLGLAAIDYFFMIHTEEEGAKDKAMAWWALYRRRRSARIMKLIVRALIMGGAIGFVLLFFCVDYQRTFGSP